MKELVVGFVQGLGMGFGLVVALTVLRAVLG